MGRGRPKGSKNKPKTEAAPATAPVVKKKPGRKPKTLVPPPPNEKAMQEVRVVFHLKGGTSHAMYASKDEGFRIANEWAAFVRRDAGHRSYNCPETIAGDGWAILTSEVAAVIAIPIPVEMPKKRGRPAKK